MRAPASSQLVQATTAVVVLGMPRSGTTLLKEMLDHHPAVAIPPESYFIPSLWRRYRVRKDARHLLGDLAALPQLRLWGVDLDEVRRRVEPGARFADVIAAVYGAYAAGRGKLRYGDKTPAYLEDLGILEHAFPGAQYLHIIRDGRDAALSYEEMGIGSPRNLGFPSGLADFAWRWHVSIVRARCFGEACGRNRYREVRYERLTTEPETALREICGFLGMDYDPEVLAYHRDASRGALPHHARLAESPSLGARDWRRQMPKDAIVRFEALAGKTLSELGYERSIPSHAASARVRASVDRLASEVRVICWRAIAGVGALTPFWRAHQLRRFRRDRTAQERSVPAVAGTRVSPRRLLLYAIGFAPLIGGEERYLLRLGTALSRDGGTPVATGGVEPDGIRPRIVVTLVTRTPSNGYDDSALRFAVLRQPSLATLWRRLGDADVLHLSGPVLLPLLLGYLRRKPTVITHHMHHAACPNGLFFHHPSASICPGHFQARNFSACLRCNALPRGWLRSLVELFLTFPRRWLCQRVDLNLVVSHTMSRRLGLLRSTTVYHGITAPVGGETTARAELQAIGASRREPCFAYVGRLVPEKGVALLLRAAAQVATAGYACGVRVIGDGPERGALEELARQLGMEGRVEFTGFLSGSEMLARLDDVMAVVAPSLCEEAAGLAVIEHMARGGLVIAAGAGGLVEMVGDAGMTFPPGDTDALADCLRRALDDPSMAVAYAVAASRRAQEVFCGEHDVRAHVAAYCRLLPSR